MESDEEPVTRGVASGIYGLVVAGATLATSASLNAFLYITIAVVVTVLIYWAAETYAHALAVRTVRGHALSRPELLVVLRQGWPLVSASYLPLLALLVVGLLGGSVTAAVYTALIVATLLLGAAGWTASRRSGLRGAALVGSTALALLFGLAMIVLKQKLH